MQRGTGTQNCRWQRPGPGPLKKSSPPLHFWCLSSKPAPQKFALVPLVPSLPPVLRQQQDLWAPRTALGASSMELYVAWLPPVDRGPVPVRVTPAGWTRDHTFQSGPEVYCPLPQATIPTPPNNYKSKKNACPLSPFIPEKKNAIIYEEKTQSKAAGGLSPSSSRW